MVFYDDFRFHYSVALQPNGVTGPRTPTLVRTSVIRNAGNVFLCINVASIGYSYGQASLYDDKAGETKAVADAAVLTFGVVGGPPGWAVVAGYGLGHVIFWPLYVEGSLY